MRSRALGTFALALGVLIALEVALYFLWPRVVSDNPRPTLEGQVVALAGLLVLLLPHVIAFLSTRGGPALLRVAGSMGVVLTCASVLGWSVIFFTIPLVLIPSVVYLARSERVHVEPRVPTPLLAAAAVVLMLAAAWSLFLTEDPRCSIIVRRGGELVREEPATCNPNSSGSLGPEIVEWSGNSDAIVMHEALLSLALSGSVISICLHGGRPKKLHGSLDPAVPHTGSS